MKSEKSHHIFLFEPLNDSPISVLWDLVLAFYVVRLAALYSLLTLSSHLLLSHLAPSTTTTTAITTLLAAALWTRYVMQRWQVPPAVGFRGAVGLLAGGMIWVVEEVLWGVGLIVKWEIDIYPDLMLDDLSYGVAEKDRKGKT
ncbi:hypothetical protein QBC41DRAFT_377115 [Cercophora samala]|uniref:Uncharacterized protein n=1 Tax=Cercophora samala TaxID=330535 RepID=A0AA40D4Y6_9PEZI|nr:hypothetical protein QBC41DRAFT_377115 [Cercophora samala]